MSYVRLDDEHENGRLTQFRERLSGEVRMQTGEPFEIFQDRNDIAWGEQWKKRLEDSLDAVTFLIPIVTPAFFKSSACRGELERFLKRESDLDRYDLILPVYYVECATLSAKAKRDKDPLAKAVAARQYVDWRELRFEPWASPQVGKMLEKMARQIVEALERNHAVSSRSSTIVQASLPVEILGTVDSTTRKMLESMRLKRSERGPVPKTEVPTLVVDAFHRGDHPTLTQALEAAEPGTRILVRPGLYREGVFVDKPVEIIGEGEQADIVIEASGKSAILFRADMGRIANLTLRQAGGGPDSPCVVIDQGRLDLEDCDISSQSSACIVIRGGADPRLRRNRAHNGRSVGVYVLENSQGTLEDNEILANVYGGVAIREGGNPTLRRNRISRNGAGILVMKGGAGIFEENDLRGNTKGAWAIAPGAESKVRRTDNIE